MFENFKAELINIFILTMDQITKCDVKMVAQPGRRSQAVRVPCKTTLTT